MVGCSALDPPSRIVYRDASTRYTVRANEAISLATPDEAEPGKIHRSVLEYVLAAPESPLTAYYDLVLGLADPPKRVRDDLQQLARSAASLANGKPPRGRDYARALARRLAPEINRALEMNRTSPLQEWKYLGTAGLWWGDATDLAANVLLKGYEREFRCTALRTVIYRYASKEIIRVLSTGTDRDLVWDVSNVPGAFDPAAVLDYDTVAARIVALHPYTTAPARLP
jgi:hypothetical protein